MAMSATRKEFNKAFRSARNAGKKVFAFKGKKYTTELASEKKKMAVPDPSPRGSTQKSAPKGTRGARKNKPAVDSGMSSGKGTRSSKGKAAPAPKKTEKPAQKPTNKGTKQARANKTTTATLKRKYMPYSKNKVFK